MKKYELTNRTKQEDKKLLLVDLCGRLPYGVIVDYAYNTFDVHNGNYVKHGEKCILKCYLLDIFMSPRQNENGEYIKPYLRPMSSMTTEERQDWIKYCKADYDCEFQPEPTFDFESCILSIHWLNKNHFDYRGLIPKGLAIEVTKENNPYASN